MNNVAGWVGIWAAATLLPIGVVTAAEPAVGSQAPEVHAQAWLNAKGPTTLAGLRGKVVVVEFWATWCGPCLQSMPHIDDLAKKWADKGLTVLSLTREGRQTVERFLRLRNFEPSYTIGCGTKSSPAYGVRGIPRAFVIDPDGAVAWVGHPMSGLDEVIAGMLASDDPPTTAPATSAPATDPNDDELSTAAEALSQVEYAKSLAILEDVLTSAEDEERVQRASQLMAEVLEVGDGKLNEAQSLLKQKKHVEAAELLRGLAEQFADTEVGRKARARLMALRRQPEASLALQQDQWRQEADAMLARADVLVEQKRYAQAAERYRLVTMLYSRTDAGAKARLKVRQLEEDEQIAAQIREQKATRQAVGWLSIARSYARIGRDARARTSYKKVIRAYPDTPYAEAAKQEMENLAGEPAAGED